MTLLHYYTVSMSRRRQGSHLHGRRGEAVAGQQQARRGGARDALHPCFASHPLTAVVMGRLRLGGVGARNERGERGD
jgi:hypothetical protein